MNSYRIKGRFIPRCLVLGLILAGFACQSAMAGQTITYYLKTFSNNYMSASQVADGDLAIKNAARWQELAMQDWVITGTTTNLGDAPLTFYFTRIKDYYKSDSYADAVQGSPRSLTNFYYPYSNTLSVVVTGITTSASANWRLTSWPANEYTNSSAYSTYGTNFTDNFTLTTIPTGTYSFVFYSVRGHQSPPATNVNITGVALTNFSTNAYIPYTNSLSVVIDGRGTNNIIWSVNCANNGNWTNMLSPGTSFTNDYTLAMIPTGSYTVTFPSLGSGFTAPAAITTNITGILTPTITGTYARILGNLQISMTPAAAAASAPWLLSTCPSDFTTYTNKTSGTGNYTYSNVPIGSYTVTFQELLHYNTPAASSGSVISNGATTLPGAYTFNGHTLVVHIEAPFARQSLTALPGIGSGPCRVAYTNSVESTISTQTAASVTYSVYDDDTVILTALTNYVYKWYINKTGTTASGINGTTLFTNSYSFIMDSDKAVWLLYSQAYSNYDHAGDIDHDLLPDTWEVYWFGDGGNTESATAPQAELFTNAYANGDNDFIPSVSTNPPMQISISTNGVITCLGAGGSIPGYPLQRTRLLSQMEAGSGLGYATGLKFNNLLECRGLDLYYLTNGPSGWIASDDPLTDPTKDDTDGDSMTDGWEYYFWYWRSANAYSAGLSNSANLSWVALKPSVWNMNDWDTDNDGIDDLAEHDDYGTDPTHCDTDADGMDDYWEIYFTGANSNALDNANGLLNPDGDFMAYAANGTVLSTGMAGTALGTNVCWSGGSVASPSAAWNEIYTNTGANVFDLYRDTILKASSTLTNHVAGTRYAFTNYFGTTNAGITYKDGYPVWVDVDNSGTYSSGDYALVNPALKHDGVYCMAPAIPEPGVCSFDPRTAWTNAFPDYFAVIHDAPNTIDYTTYQEYLGGDYIGRLSWDAGGQMSVKNDDEFALNRNSYSNPRNQDTDADLIPDGWELYTGLNDNNAADASADPDHDALNNLGEWANVTHLLGTCIATWPNKPWPTDPGAITAPSPNDPHPRDTDWDGLVDGYEELTFYEGSSSSTTNIGEFARLTNPTEVDTDRLQGIIGEGLPDGWEVYAGTDPLTRDANLDLDFDGLLNWQEYWTGTVPEWMDCDPAWGMKFLARRFMDWNPPWTDSPTNSRYTTFGDAVKVDTRWFIPPDFLTCPSFIYANGVTNDLAWLRSTNGFPAASSLGCQHYHTTFANRADSDDDGMDDFWEVFHCLNPARGYSDLIYGAWNLDMYGSWLITGSTDADPNTPGYQVGTQGSPFTNVLDIAYYYRTLRAIQNNPNLQATMVVAIIGPHNFGLVGMDPDNDGLANFDEYTYYWQSHLHTSPTPIWRTDPYLSGVYSFVPLNYTRDNTASLGGFNTLGFNGGIMYSAARGTLPFRWAAMTEGFDTDNDLISDYDEVTGYRTNGVTAGTDPLWDESPLHNRVLWLDGTNSWARSYAWSHYGDFSKFSVEAWVRPSRLSSAADQVVVEKTSGYTMQLPDGTFGYAALANLQLGISSNGMPYVLFHDVSGYTTHRAISSRVGILQVNNWAHLAGVFDGSNLTLYVNGEISATHHTTDVPARGIEGNYGVWHPNCNLSIGARELNPGGHFPMSGNKFFAGCIDEVRVWDRVISAAEIKARKDRRLTPEEVGTVIGGNGPYAEGANNLFAYYRFTDLPDPKVEGIAPSEFPTNRPALSMNYSRVYTNNYLVMAHDRVKNIPRLPPLDTRVVIGVNRIWTPVDTNGTPDAYGITTTNYLGIQLPSDFRNTATPYNFTHTIFNIDMGRGAWLCGNAQGLRTNTWLPTLDPNDPDSTDSDGDGLPDWWEQLYGLDIYDATGDNGAWGDPDNDGLNNRAEYLAGTNPRNSDTDGDGIGDYDSRSGPYQRTWGEMYMDGDGMPDVWEMQYGLDPYHYDANLDLDGDGWSNLAEYQAGTNPNDSSSVPSPQVIGTVGYFGSRNIEGNNYRFYAYSTNTMDGIPAITKVGAGQQVTGTGTADGTRYFNVRLPIYPLDESTVVTISVPVGSNSAVFVFTSPTTYTYTGPGQDYAAGLNYVTGILSIRWASGGIPAVGAGVSIDYVYLNRNSAVFNLTGFKEGDTYIMGYIDLNNSSSFDMGEPMGILDDQPLDINYTSPNNIRIQVKDSAPGYGRFVWTGNTDGTGDYSVVINRISEQNAPTVFTRTMRWSRNFVHEWDYQLAGLYGLPNGHYQWWANGQEGTFNTTWPASVSTPSLVYPRGELLNYAVNQFKWTMDVNSTLYHLQVARQASDRSLTFVLDNYYPTPYCDQDGVSQADLPKYAGELGDGVYHWRVASWSPAGESAWSDVQTFEINLNATNSHWIAGNIYYFGKAECSNIVVEAFANRGFSGKPEARVLLTGASPSPTNSFKGSFTLRGLEAGTYYVRAYLDVTPAGGTRDGKLDKPWESYGFIRDPNNDYQPRALALLNTMFIDGTKLVIRDQDIDNDLLPDAWEMTYFGDLNQTGDMDYDGDGETNLEEYMRDGVNMNPANWDTDGDGLSDHFEMNYTGASFGFSAKSGGLNPTLWDTDGDGYSDGAELKRYHTNPLDPTSYPRYQPMCFDAARSPGDYDGDGRSDLNVYDVANGHWYLMTAGGLFFNLPFGSAATLPMVGDYTGDGCDEFSLFNASTGDWHLYDVWTGQSFSTKFGDSEMIPVPADYSGDDKTDLAVYYPAEGTWFIYNMWTGDLFTLAFGGPTWIPVPGDYNNDGAADLAVYEPSSGNWKIFAFDHYRHEGQYFSGNFGGPTMIPVPGDYDGDGRNDIALFDTSNANWYILTWRGQFLSGQFGCYGCIPVAGDYDGDGRTDVCVYYPPTGIWYILCWSGQSYQVQFGWPAATPILKGR